MAAKKQKFTVRVRRGLQILAIHARNQGTAKVIGMRERVFTGMSPTQQRMADDLNAALTWIVQNPPS